MLVIKGEWIVLGGGFERVVKSVCGGGGLIRDEWSPLRRFGWWDKAPDVGVPRSWREKLLGWSWVEVILGFAVLVLRVVSGVVGVVELFFSL